MIVAYYTNKEKYLQKENYRKDFDVNSLEELIKQIKVDEPILIMAKKQDVFDFKFKSKIDGNFDYKIISDENDFNEETICRDLSELHRGLKDYVKYSVKPELQDKIGKVVYLTKDRDIRDYILKNTNDLAIEVSQLGEFHHKVLSNGDITKYLVKLMFDGNEVT